MRGISQTAVVVALVSALAAFTIMSLVAVGDAMIAVSFTQFGTGDSLVADDWDLCQSFESATCG